MERFCGFLKKSLKSKRVPWANVSQKILHRIYLNQLSYRYNLREELGELAHVPINTGGENEKMYDNCMTFNFYICFEMFLTRDRSTACLGATI